METTMDDQNDKDMNGNSKSEEESQKQDIPLWLQGLDEPDQEDTSPVNTESPSDDDWIKETNESSASTAEEMTDSAAVEEKKDLPDWLDELSQAERHTPAVLGNLQENEEDTTDGEITSDKETLIEDQTSGEVTAQNVAHDEIEEHEDDSYLESPADQGFVEISGFDLDENSVSEPIKPDEGLDEEQALPHWLREMIAEPPESPNEPLEVPSADIDENSVSETTEPAVVSGGSMDVEEEHSKPNQAAENIDETIDEEEPSEVIDELQEDQDQQDIESEQSGDWDQEPFEDKAPETVIEGETEPATNQIEDQELGDEEPEVLETEPEHAEEMPKNLHFAKELLDQGSTSRALEIIKTYIEEDAFLEEIQTWLEDIVSNDPESKHDIWESLGDIALKRGNPDDAFNAYTKALVALLASDKEYNETH